MKPAVMALAVILVLGGVTVAAIVVSQRELRANEREQVVRRGTEAVTALRVRLSAYAEVLYGLRGDFAGAAEPSRADFHRRVASLELGRRYPGIQAVGFAQPVSGPEVPALRAAFRADVRASGLPYPDLTLAPRRGAGDRLPITFIEPQAGNEAAVGLDFLADRVRGESVRRTIHTGEVAATAPLTLVQDAAGQRAVLLHLAVWRRDRGDRQIAGVVYTAFRMGDLARSVFGASDDADIEIYDVGAVGGPSRPREASTLAVDLDADGTQSFAGGDRLTAVLAMEVGGRRWQIVQRLANSPLSRSQRWLPLLIALGGGLLALAAGGLVWLLGTARLRALRAAQRMTEELRDSERAMADILEFAPDAFLLVDERGGIVMANARMEQLFGYGREELIGQSMEMLLPERLRGTHGEHRAAYGRAPAFRAMGQGRELLGRRKGGEEFPVDISLGPLETRHGRRTAAIVRDATDRRAVERMKEEFVALASHELRTPLTSVLGYLEILDATDEGTLTDRQRRFLGVARRNAERLSVLVADILLVARADAGRMPLNRVRLDLAELAADRLEDARPSAAEAGVALRLDAVGEHVVEGDGARLGQVLDNLISNALKFTPSGGRVTVGVRRERGCEVLSVSDTGVGIPAAEQGRLFERFYRTRSAADQAVPGTGLGLAICRMIVESHGGRIALCSSEGEGTTVTVELDALHHAPVPAGPVGVGLPSVVTADAVQQ